MSRRRLRTRFTLLVDLVYAMFAERGCESEVWGLVMMVGAGCDVLGRGGHLVACLYICAEDRWVRLGAEADKKHLGTTDVVVIWRIGA